MKKKTKCLEEWKLLDETTGEVFSIPSMPMQVHEILAFHGKIGDGWKWGKTADCAWVNAHDWRYEGSFSCEGPDVLLQCEGLDTVCEIQVNGKQAGTWKDCYLPAVFDLKGVAKPGKNLLTIRFLSMNQVMKEMEERHQEEIQKDGLKPAVFLRKTFHDFTTYLGNDDNFWKIGVFGDLWILEPEEGDFLDTPEITYVLNETLTTADIQICPNTYRKCPDSRYHVEISRNGQVLWKKTGEKDCFKTRLSDIALWWPRGYGEPSLYKVCIQLYRNGKLVDEQTRKIGFRKIQMGDVLDFWINRVPVKLWGANLTPDQGQTLCEDTERILRLVFLAEDAHVNTLRLWGEGVPFSETLYEYADAHGILLWQEFFCGHAQYPRCLEVMDQIKEEASWMIRTRKHHPSILLWCGGNECYLSRDFASPEKEYLAAGFFEYELKHLCLQLDPDRVYLPSSPFFGTYTNDPSMGDTHSYTNSWYVPGSEYPVFASENLRVSFPKEESLKRYLQMDVLPVPEIQRHGDLPWPSEYETITSAESWKKIPPVEQFYEAVSPEAMIYRFGMAAGQYIQDSVERYRRGKTPENTFEKRKCRGHFIWKWNTTFPHIYSSMIDAYLEPKMPYYFLKRAYESLKVSIECGDHLYVWGINDTPDLFCGTIEVKLFDLEKNAYEKESHFPAQILAGDSMAVGNLDAWGQMTRDKILHGWLKDREGKILGETVKYLDIERHIKFPEAEIFIRQEGNRLYLLADHFARCVVLEGKEKEDTYGWDFSDNYFDLFPGEEYCIEVKGAHVSGQITAKPFYQEKAAVLVWQEPEE